MNSVSVVAAVIKNEEHEILCALRSESMSLPGFWEFPGGKIRCEETPQEALVREIREELGCDIEVGGFITQASHEYPNALIILSTYYASIMKGEPVAKEHEQIVWMPLHKLKSLAWAPADIPTVTLLTGGFIE
ncbi:8-oxo-dGTP diphosphatase [Alicyclobacillus hesperidum]|nr:8-oxo-dGTP diphosphatase [Alicyclobacillus hesperidum]